jgi:cysteine synthase A
MAKVYDNVLDLVGNTPIVKLNNLTDENMADIYVKLEYFNPGSSVKDRIAKSMIEAAEKEGKIKPGDTIVEPTSGNTGVGLAYVAAAKGYKVVITMPETFSIERRKLMQGYGATLVLTPGSEGMKGAIKKATELSKENGWFMPLQFDNPANVKAHINTGKEIIDAFGVSGIDAFVAGVGTGGTITGAGGELKRVYPNLQIFAVEAADSPVLSGGAPGPHKLQGISPGFVPSILNTEIYDEILPVTNDEGIETARLVAHKEGLLVGISAGAAIFQALNVAKRLGKGKKVLAIVPDNAERYLSTPLFDFE